MNNHLYLPSWTLATWLLFTACSGKSPEQHHVDDAESPSHSDPFDSAMFVLIPGKQLAQLPAERMSLRNVLDAYGESAREDSIYLGEGISGKGVVLFHDNPAQRMELYWDESVDSLPSFIRITGDESGHSAWRTEAGITIGTTIKEVERINGKPFRLYGFDWDFGGLVTSWEGGSLPPTLGLSFTYQTPELPGYLAGDRELTSNEPALLLVNPVVASIVSSFRE